MAKTKFARVDARRSDVAAAAHWLLNEFDAAAFSSAILTNEPPEYYAANAKELGKLFLKKGRRRGADPFQMPIPRDLAAWFGVLGAEMLFLRQGTHLLPLASACSAATSKRAGGKRVDLAEKLERAKCGSDNERNRRRLKKEDREEKTFREAIRRGGGSIIGAAFADDESSASAAPADSFLEGSRDEDRTKGPAIPVAMAVLLNLAPKKSQ
jgi:hypothetical protein